MYQDCADIIPASSQQNYGITELELFGLTINITAFKNYLLHVFVEAYVDHSAIPWLMKAKTETKTTRIFRLLEILQKYHFAMKDQPGKEMYIADFLSHHPETHTDNDILPLSFEVIDSHRENFLRVTMRSMTKTIGSEKPADPVIPTSTSSSTVPHSLLPVHRTLRRASKTSSAVDWEALAKQLIKKAAEPKAEPEAPLHEVLNPIPCGKQARNFAVMTSDFVLVNGLLFKLLWKCKVMDNPSMVLCVPEEYVPQILYHYHDYIMSVHQGIVRTVREKYFFPNMFEKV